MQRKTNPLTPKQQLIFVGVCALAVVGILVVAIWLYLAAKRDAAAYGEIPNCTGLTCSVADVRSGAALDAAGCRTVRGTIADVYVNIGYRGLRSYDAKVSVAGEAVYVAGSLPLAVWQRLRPGDTVGVQVWEGRTTALCVAGEKVTTGDHPERVEEASRQFFLIAVILALGWVYVVFNAVHLYRTHQL